MKIASFSIICLALLSVACGGFAEPPPLPEVDSGSIPLSDTRVVFDRSVIWFPSTPHDSRPARCVKVYDGDTIRTDSDEVIRFLGINTPEIAHPERGETMAEPYGDEAKRFLSRMLLGKRITLIVPRERPKDIYNRTLALVMVDDRIANMELIQAGLAKTYFIDNRSIINEWAWYSIQEEVRQKRLGVWRLETETAPAR
jgi:micrococcal nuclease